jgi:hypothetical protein
MSSDPALFDASKAAAHWARLLARTREMADRGETLYAYALLFELRKEVARYGPALDAASGKLAGASAGIVHYEWLEGRRSAASAHEAVAALARLALLDLVFRPGLGREPVPPDWQETAERELARCRQSLLTGSAASELEALICRERAELVKGMPEAQQEALLRTDNWRPRLAPMGASDPQELASPGMGLPAESGGSSLNHRP